MLDRVSDHVIYFLVKFTISQKLIIEDGDHDTLSLNNIHYPAPNPQRDGMIMHSLTVQTPV